MKNIIFFIAIFSVLAACNNQPSNSAKEETAVQENSQEPGAMDENIQTENLSNNNVNSFIRDEFASIVSESSSEAILKVKKDIVVRLHSTAEYKPYTDSLYSANSQIKLDSDDWLDYKLPDSGAGFKKLYSRD